MLSSGSSPNGLSRNFSDEYVVRHTSLPPDHHDTPSIIGWSGPARSGTTALLYFLATHPDVDRAYFQPQKTLMRSGSPLFKLNSSDSIVCMKEVFGGDGVTIDRHDPVELLVKAGVPKDKITWIIMLRDPCQAFKSLYHGNPDLRVETYSAAQSWSLELFSKYKRRGVKVIPLVYELTQYNEGEILSSLLEKVYLRKRNGDLGFDVGAVADKLVPGQLSDSVYFDKWIRAIVDKKKFIYSKNDYDEPADLILQVEAACREQYESFKKVAENEFYPGGLA